MEVLLIYLWNLFCHINNILGNLFMSSKKLRFNNLKKYELTQLWLVKENIIKLIFAFVGLLPREEPTKGKDIYKEAKPFCCHNTLTAGS